MGSRESESAVGESGSPGVRESESGVGVGSRQSRSRSPGCRVESGVESAVKIVFRPGNQFIRHY